MVEKKNRTIAFTRNARSRTPAPHAVVLVAAVIISTLAGASARAVPPIDALPTPQYSFRIGSPSLAEPTIDASSVLVQQGLKARVLVDAFHFGLGDANDDVDALSGATMTAPPALFILMFSVDEQSFGTARPDTLAVAADVPFNAWDQALRGQQAGDLFMSCTVFDSGQSAPTLVVQSGEAIPNNVLITNNYDEGGVDFAAKPVASADQVVAAGTQQDVVDAAAYIQSGDFFFSASQSSPSLTLSSASGADVFFYDAALGRVSVFALAEDLGLTVADDIDAMIVFDANSDRTFGANDLVLFSLAPNSPSLAIVPGASAVAGAADVFLAHTATGLTVLASAVDLGLGSPGDNIDALEVDYCVGALDYAAAHGIRDPGGSGSPTPPSSAQVRPNNRGGRGNGK